MDDVDVTLGLESSPHLAATISRSARAVDRFGLDVGATLAWVRSVGRDVASAPHAAGWESLAAAAAVDVAGARMLEPHVDALQILEQAARVDAVSAEAAAGPDATWGVFAAEGKDVSVRAREREGRWILSGTKPWCSLATHLSHALVTAWTAPDERRLFAVDLRSPGVHPHAGPWVSRGLAQVVSAPVDFDDAVATPIGDDGWYLRRPGFAWGGIGVAAVWWGASLPVVGALARAAAREGADQLAAAYAGEADAASWAARAVLADAAGRAARGVDAPAVLAHRVRATVAETAERIASLAEQALGPGPLTTDEPFARRIADLRIYLRQHHGRRDLAGLGRKVSSS
jgi:alkylation response protein AidB-like acyl-CoA dehydrogenase